MVSGINHGPNLADDVTYSGTVAAAMEASMLGVPAIAFSLATRKGFEFAEAARFAGALARAALAQPLRPGMLLNVNIPAGPLRGYRITRLGKHSYGFDVIEKVDPRGRKYYWIGGSEYQYQEIPGTDVHAVLKESLVSITPLHLDLTDDGHAGRGRGLERPGVREVLTSQPTRPGSRPARAAKSRCSTSSSATWCGGRPVARARSSTEVRVCPICRVRATTPSTSVSPRSQSTERSPPAFTT